MIFLLYLLLGILSGFLAGFLGLGGGFIVVPALYTIFHYQSLSPEYVMHLAAGSSLAIVACQSFWSALAHHQKKPLARPFLETWIPAVSLGAISGALLAHWLSTEFLRTLFGVLVLFAAWQTFIHFQPKKLRQVPTRMKQFLTTGAIAFLAAMIGIGGASLLVPFGLSCGLKMKESVGVAAACGSMIALFGTIGFMITGWGLTDELRWATGHIYWPAVLGIIIAGFFFVRLGVSVAHQVQSQWIQRTLIVILTIIGVRMLFFE